MTSDPLGEQDHWTARFSRPILFIIVALIGMGAYLAFTIPVAVFPSTLAYLCFNRGVQLVGANRAAPFSDGENRRFEFESF